MSPNRDQGSQVRLTMMARIGPDGHQWISPLDNDHARTDGETFDVIALDELDNLLREVARGFIGPVTAAEVLRVVRRKLAETNKPPLDPDPDYRAPDVGACEIP